MNASDFELTVASAARSPDLESVNKRVGTAGWALRTETLENTRMVDDEDDDLNWGSQVSFPTLPRVNATHVHAKRLLLLPQIAHLFHSPIVKDD